MFSLHAVNASTMAVFSLLEIRNDGIFNGILKVIFIATFFINISSGVVVEADYRTGVPFLQSTDLRVDCHPDKDANQQTCNSRGCMWVPSSEPGAPACYFPDGYGYHPSSVTKTGNGYEAELYRNPTNTIFGKEIDFLKLSVYEETSSRLRLKFEDKSQKRYEVPLEIPPPPSSSPNSTDYAIDFSTTPQFGVEVTRTATGTKIFDTNVPGMVYSDQFLQITTKLASKNIYGLGEHFHTEYAHNTNWKHMSFFARDMAPQDPSLNIYGVHPFYMNVEEDGNAHGVFLLNSNAMEVVLQPYPAITFRTIGGILDFYIFTGPAPEDVVQQYLEVIGLPMMPPYWSLGFQLSRYGYTGTEEVRNVSSRMISNKIPYDVQYLDIDYMEDYKDFTVDSVNFNGLKEFVENLHSEHGVKLVPIVDCAIGSNESLVGHYPALDMGKELDIFIKVNETILEGQCWPGNVYYPDFSNPNALSYWTQMFSDFRQILPYDGIWIDMNEPSDFPSGSISGCDRSSLNYPPYAAGVAGSENDNMMFEKTICMDADQHYGKHYDVHSLYGTFEANATYTALRQIIPGNLRPMIVSRSTYPGAGRHTTHWLGDNFSSWLQMQISIIGILEFNLFGFPFVGADICGFNDDTTEELCYRWMQLGAFYPFSRNHNTIGAKAQDPTSLGERVITASRESLLTRYELLPYLYTLFHFAHTQGSTVARPLLHEFPGDANTWTIKYQFLWGPALLISPILFEGATSVEAYFPEGIWYEFYSGAVVKGSGEGKTITLQDSGKMNLHVRGGHILPLQQPAVTTTRSRENPMGLFISPNETGSAKGVLFWDDGISHETQESEIYTFLEFEFKEDSEQGKLTSVAKINNYPETDQLFFEYIAICGQSSPSSIVVNGVQLETNKWKYTEETRSLLLDQLTIPVTQDLNLVINH